MRPTATDPAACNHEAQRWERPSMLMRRRSADVDHVERGAPDARFAYHHATSVGAQAVGARSVAALALGAMAVGALAIGALAIGRLAIGRARIRRLEIDELVVRRLRIIEQLEAPKDRDAEG